MTRLRIGLENTSTSLYPYLKNISIYEKIFGLLYLQPLYIYRLLINPNFTENDKVFRLIQDLYVKSSASGSKNLTYQMSICLMLLKHEQQALLENDLGGPVFDLYSIKMLLILYTWNPVVSEYYGSIKKEYLKVILRGYLNPPEILKKKRTDVQLDDYYTQREFDAPALDLTRKKKQQEEPEMDPFQAKLLFTFINGLYPAFYPGSFCSKTSLWTLNG